MVYTFIVHVCMCACDLYVQSLFLALNLMMLMLSQQELECDQLFEATETDDVVTVERLIKVRYIDVNTTDDDLVIEYSYTLYICTTLRRRFKGTASATYCM